ncbi:probable ubiE/COQ5 methyltransferase [Phialocephala subalpina]|uniref:Probable ubiE/COQ5 methyltransferase n=1 Tax=Phialocephala subalpina TaxID=576137 RepID=A0A1L7X3D7_9HELO|nr:probable ubiE/COQ5 methyltransferase [Phialocephala subalpina]
MATKEHVYTSDHSAAVLATHSWRTVQNSAAYLIPYLKPDFKLLDAGCGPGTITVDLARFLPEGHVIGVEYSAEPLSQARTFAEQQGVKNVEFRVEDIHELPFEDGTFDVVHAHQCPETDRTFREMERVTKKGGIVACRESASMTWYPQSKGLAKWYEVHMKVAGSKGSNPNSGNRIHAWAREAGFKVDGIKCTAGTWCFASKEEREYWGGRWEKRTSESVFNKLATERGYATEEELKEIGKAWKAWEQDEDGWFTILHGEIICKV